MAAGLTACLLIALYILDEFSYDRFHANADRIYQVGLHNKYGDTDVRSVSVCPPLADAMMAEIPEVESTLRMSRWRGKPVFRIGEKAFSENNVFTTEGNFFDFFSFRLVSGNSKTVLKEPNSVVLTETTARRYFGNENPLEKLITFGEGDHHATWKVTGVAADCPTNSHFSFNVLISAAGPDNYFEMDYWRNGGVLTYFLLRTNASVSEAEKKFETIVNKYLAPGQQFFGNSLDQFRKSGGVYSYYKNH